MDKFVIDSILKERFEKLYQDSIVSDLPREFFSTLYEYVHLFKTNIQLQGIIEQVVLPQKQTDLQKLENLQQQFINECKTIFEKIKPLFAPYMLTINKEEIEKIKNTPGVQIVQEKPQKPEDYEIRHALFILGAFFTNHADSTEGFVDAIKSQIDIVSTELTKKQEIKFKALLQEFGEYDDNDTIIGWRYGIVYSAYEEERKRMERLQHTTIWYPWTELDVFYDLFNTYDQNQKQTNQYTDFIKFTELKIVDHDFGEIFHKKEPENIAFLDLKVFKSYLRRFHREIIHLLMTNKTASNDTEELPEEEFHCGNFTVNFTRAIMQYKDNPIVDISPDNQEEKLLKLLLENKNKLVEYKDIAKRLRFNSYRETDEDRYKANAYYAEKSKDIKKSLITLLKRTRITNNEIKELIVPKKKHWIYIEMHLTITFFPPNNH